MKTIRSSRSLQFAIVFSVLIVAVATQLFRTWIVTMGTWGLFGCAAIWATERKRLPGDGGDWMRRAQLGGFVVFPIVSSWYKNIEWQRSEFERSQFANRLQHAGWALAMCLLFAPIVWTHRQHIGKAIRMSWIAGLVLSLGSIGEIFEYAVRPMANDHIARFIYSDTIKDLTTNVVGCCLGVLAVLAIERFTAPPLAP